MSKPPLIRPSSPELWLPRRVVIGPAISPPYFSMSALWRLYLPGSPTEAYVFAVLPLSRN